MQEQIFHPLRWRLNAQGYEEEEDEKYTGEGHDAGMWGPSCDDNQEEPQAESVEPAIYSHGRASTGCSFPSPPATTNRATTMWLTMKRVTKCV